MPNRMDSWDREESNLACLVYPASGHRALSNPDKIT